MISKLYAAEAVTQPATQGKGTDLLMSLVPFVLIFVIFYFLLIRPQRKKQAAHKGMLDSLKVGDKVLLNSGMVGKITKVNDNGYAKAEIASGVEVEIMKSYVISVITDNK